jgi:tetrahydromethanopterin S-methyltransferase subunit G
MGAVDDTRKVLPDFLAPELREIKARLDALEKRMDERFTNAEKLADERLLHVQNLMSERFDNIDRRSQDRQEALLTSINNLANFNEVRERLARLESREPIHQ